MHVDKLEDVYDAHFFCRVLNKNMLAKQHFRNTLKLDESLQEWGTIDTKWNEIKKFVEFIAVNSKIKLFLRCH